MTEAEEAQPLSGGTWVSCARRIARETIAAVALLALGFSLAACSDSAGSDEQADAAAGGSAGHIHGLGVNPADGALFVATHNGLFRAEQGSGEAEQVGTSSQDTMGFSITGADQFLGSGHPGPGEGGPPNLGLIRSADAGQSWETISLAGEADFHVLRSQGERVYGFNGLSGQLMVSSDGGSSWQSRQPPAPMLDLAIDPADPDRVIAATERGLGLSDNGGDSWKPVSPTIGLIAWPSESSFYAIDAEGAVLAGKPAGELERVGEIGGQPVAFIAADEGQLYAALADGTVLGSDDGGSSWEPRARVG